MAGQSIEADVQGLQQQLSDVMQRISVMQGEQERVKAPLRKIVYQCIILNCFALGTALFMLIVGALNHWPVYLAQALFFPMGILTMLILALRVQLGDIK